MPSVENRKHPFEQIESVEPPKRLFHRILSRLNLEKKLETSRERTLYFTFALIFSLAAFLLVCVALQNVLVQSELLRILSLLFSDPKAVLANWRDFSLLVLESLPAVSLAIFFAATLLFLGSLKYVAKYLAQMLSWSERIKKIKHGYK